MRFRQAMSVLAQAMEAAAKLHGIPASYTRGRGGAMCTLSSRIAEPSAYMLKEPTYSDAPAWYKFKDDAARLALFAGVTREHAKQLDAHIFELTRKDAYLPDYWAKVGHFGLAWGYTDAQAFDARRAWLRTLGRTAPAKAVHAPE